MHFVHSGMPPITQATFFFDPGCPWTWVTSRWLVGAAEARDIDVDWRPYSLKIKHGDQVPDQFRELVKVSHRALRVIARLRAEVGNDAVAAFYAERGYQGFGHDEWPSSDKVLSAVGLDPAFAAAEDDESLDAGIQASMDEAHALAGDGIGSPILAIGDRGFFGPVLTGVPDDPGPLWDHLVGLWQVPELHELKRDRSTGPQFPSRP